MRTGTSIDALRDVPGPSILAVQLSDGPLEAEPDLLEATLHHRQLPGEGEFDLRGLVGALGDTGTRAPIGVEVFSDELHALPADSAARAAARATLGVLHPAG